MSDDSADRYDNEFAKLAFAVLPAQTSKRLSLLTGYDQRLCQRWLAGQIEPADDAVEILLKQHLAVHELELGDDIRELFERALAHGAHPETIGSWVWLEYEKQLGRTPK